MLRDDLIKKHSKNDKTEIVEPDVLLHNSQCREADINWVISEIKKVISEKFQSVQNAQNSYYKRGIFSHKEIMQRNIQIRYEISFRITQPNFCRISYRTETLYRDSDGDSVTGEVLSADYAAAVYIVSALADFFMENHIYYCKVIRDTDPKYYNKTILSNIDFTAEDFKNEWMKAAHEVNKESRLPGLHMHLIMFL